MKSFLFAYLIVLLLSFANAANAQSVVIAGEPTISGSGCPGGTVAAVLAPDGSAISLLFSNFMLTRPAKVLNPAYRDCRFIIPIAVPTGYILQTTRIDYRGFASVPRFGFATINTSNLGGLARVGRPTQMTNTIGQNFLGDFTISQSSTQAWTDRCLNQPNIDFTTSITAGGSKNPKFRIPMDEDVSISLDSADIGDSGITVALKLARCR